MPFRHLVLSLTLTLSPLSPPPPPLSISLSVSYLTFCMVCLSLRSNVISVLPLFSQIHPSPASPSLPSRFSCFTRSILLLKQISFSELKRTQKSSTLPHTNKLVPHRRMLKSTSDLKRVVVVSHNSPLISLLLVCLSSYLIKSHPPAPAHPPIFPVTFSAEQVRFYRRQTATQEDFSLLVPSG